MSKRAGRGAGGATEHRAEGADAVVTEVEGDLRDGRAAAQAPHGLEHASLLAPGAEGKSGLALEAPCESARAGIERPGPTGQRTRIARRVEQGLAQRPQPRIAWHRQLQGP